MSITKILAIVVVLVALFLLYHFQLLDYLTLDSIKEHRESLNELYHNHPLYIIGGYFALYVAATALSLPIAALLTLLGGAIFGLLLGTVLVSFASVSGATLCFLFCRYLFRDSLIKRFPKELARINKGLEADGPFYLFTLRMIPVVPFFVVNIISGLTNIRTITFFFVSQIGMLAGTAVYVNAGTELAKVDSLDGILSPGLILSVTLLGIFPIIARWIIRMINNNKVMRAHKKPKKFDRNLIVIGGGSAGLVASYIGAVTKAKVTLIERHKMGGDCLNTGCVPSKAIIRSSQLLNDIAHAKRYGIKSATADFDFADIMERVQQVIRDIEPHDSVERYSKLGVECLSGQAKILSPYTVEVNGKTLSAPNLIIASGASPLVPPIPGIETCGYLTSDTLWSELKQLPKRFAVMGGGPIGCEMAQAFARLGSEVTLFERLPNLMQREDSEVSEAVLKQFKEDGINVLLGADCVGFSKQGDEDVIEYMYEGERKSMVYDKLLIALGRKANVDGFGIQELGVELTERGTVKVDEHMRTSIPTIYASGDVAGPYQFTHTASHQSWYATVNALFGTFKRFRVDYSVIPSVTFVEPEVARVGLNEAEAKMQDIAYEVTTYPLDDLDRAIADSATAGFVKVLTVPKKDRILGATIVGKHAGDLLTEFTFAMRHKLGLGKILSTIHPYPTLSEANKYAAGRHRQANAPQKVLQWAERYHKWRIK